mmetsp:Transcript_26285/g.30402  ORF Transcript_26285/g.30402 Transcript_26285/m.30402 type:complete len:83 (+) Transcript_26285:323-571(+)
MQSSSKAIDIMHKQIKNITVILLELLTQSLDPETAQRSKQTLLNHSVSIANWIHKFDPKDVNILDGTESQSFKLSPPCIMNK